MKPILFFLLAAAITPISSAQRYGGDAPFSERLNLEQESVLDMLTRSVGGKPSIPIAYAVENFGRLPTPDDDWLTVRERSASEGVIYPLWIEHRILRHLQISNEVDPVRALRDLPFYSGKAKSQFEVHRDKTRLATKAAEWAKKYEDVPVKRFVTATLFYPGKFNFDTATLSLLSGRELGRYAQFHTLGTPHWDNTHEQVDATQERINVAVPEDDRGLDDAQLDGDEMHPGSIRFDEDEFDRAEVITSSPNVPIVVVADWMPYHVHVNAGSGAYWHLVEKRVYALDKSGKLSLLFKTHPCSGIEIADPKFGANRTMKQLRFSARENLPASTASSPSVEPASAPATAPKTLPDDLTARVKALADSKAQVQATVNGKTAITVSQILVDGAVFSAVWFDPSINSKFTIKGQLTGTALKLKGGRWINEPDGAIGGPEDFSATLTYDPATHVASGKYKWTIFSGGTLSIQL